ncbi:formate dehydrogenase accessory sulfurtransferase FdhD [Acinetobacter sp. ANC 3781]
MEERLMGYEPRTVTRIQQESKKTLEDFVVQECPVALVYNGISHVVMMATPTDLVEFAKGFSLSEGIIPNLHALYAIDVQHSELGVVIEMKIASSAFVQLKLQRRQLVGRSGCGLCGIESLQQFEQQLPQVATAFNPHWLNQIEPAVKNLNRHQPLTALTGAAHAAAWVEQGEIKAIFEDVGRHNALDKLLGYLAIQNIQVAEGFVFMTSRASYELIRKCAQFNIAMLATISAPSTLAIDLAEQAGLTLASFCREKRFALYTQIQQES